MTEREAMRRALELARLGWGRVEPNPRVGAVLLRGGAVAGEGHHAEFGAAHAEVAALASCPDPRGSTLVVNLEPCAHHGRTPPCVEAVIAAGVARVVIGLRDPNPEAGGGVERLRVAGIDVAEGELRDAAAALNAPFLWGWARPHRPFVAVKLATSLDGFVADAWGTSRWVSGELAREHAHWLRAGFDAIAIGRRTAETDDPALTVRGPVTPRVPPTRIVFTRRGVLQSGLRLVRTAGDPPTVVVTGTAGQARATADLGASGVTVLAADGLAASLAALRRMGLVSVLVEGGGLLAASLLADDLVDRVYWIQAPVLLGEGTPAFGSRGPVSLGEAPRWVVTERRALGSDTLLVVDRSLCLPAL